MRCAAPRCLLRAARSRRTSLASSPRASSALVCDDGRSLDGVDSVVLLAGGLTEDNKLPTWVELRCAAAAAVHKQTGCVVVCSGNNTPHKPSNFRRLQVLQEATVLAEELIKLGVPADALLKETQSCDTLGNAFFSLTTHGLVRGFKQPVVITSDFHMRRSRAAFEWIWRLPSHSGLQFSPSLQFMSTPNGDVCGATLAARAEREAESLRKLREDAAVHNTLALFHDWIFSSAAPCD